MESNDDKTKSFITLAKDTELGHYRIIEKIGAGGMGEVYLALDMKLNRKVALKFLPSHLCQDEDCRKRFTREAQATANLDHPNIAAIHEVGEYQGRPFYAMQVVEGQSLKDLISGKDLSVERILEIAIQVCEGLQAAHEKGIIHRDIKPSNILLDDHGRVRIVDFGLASIQGSETLTKSGSTLGTIGYMSPEQIEGKPTDGRSDLFSLGVVLFELIANKSPFRRDDGTATLKAILQDIPEPLARYKSNVPDDLQRIVSKLLEKDPTLRYHSAAGVIPDLKKLSSQSTSSLTFERRRKGWNRYAVLAVMIILLAVLAIWFFGDRTEQSSESGNITRLVVLPFENLGDPEDEYFADGITDEITSRLSELSSLGVVSRTSAYSYKNTNVTIPEIAHALGVQFVLEGTIRWYRTDSLNRVRIVPQLIDVHQDLQVWSSRYDRDVTDILKLQNDIAISIVSELGGSLGSKDPAAVPTVNPEAYRYYLRGLAYFNDRAYRPAMATYKRAIELDSLFSRAYAGLSEAISNFDFWSNRELLTDRDRRLALNSAARSLQLDSNLVYGWRALGSYHYFVNYDHRSARKYFARALSLDPEDGTTNFTMGSMFLHSGDYDSAVVYLRRAVRVDPPHVNYSLKLARAYLFMRKYDMARSVLRQALSYNPGSNELWANLAQVEYVEFGFSEGLRLAIEEARRNVTDFYSSGMKTGIPDVYDLMLGDYRAVVERIKQHGFSVYVTSGGNVIDSAAYYSYLSVVCFHGGFMDDAHAYADTASRILEDRISALDLQATPAGARMAWPLSDLAAVYAILDRKDSAVSLVDRVLATNPIQTDGYQGPWAVMNAAFVLTLAGEHDRAIDLLDSLLRVPAPVSASWVRDEPFLAPLRDNPRFQALIKKYEKEHGI
jgi:serine/threonine protein kinase/tetratricopeptide (TPR) repeat protein